MTDSRPIASAKTSNSASPGWHARGYLPHFDAGETPQGITFRLAGSLPAVLLQRLRDESRMAATRGADAGSDERRRVEDYLNQGIGPVWLADPKVGAMMTEALNHFDGQRYQLHAWVVMPNHVHVVITSLAGFRVSQIVHSWKSFTATRANAMLGRTGPFWQEDYFDRLIRNELHFAAAVNYVENNPVVAGLCDLPEEWPFSSARRSAG